MAEDIITQHDPAEMFVSDQQEPIVQEPVKDHSKLDTEEEEPSSGGAKKAILILVIVILIVAIAVAVWFLVPKLQESGILGGSTESDISSVTATEVSSMAAVSQAPAPFEGQTIGQTDTVRYVMQDQMRFYAVNPETEEGTLLAELSAPCVTAAVCYDYIYVVEQGEIYTYLNRFQAQPGAAKERLRVDVDGNQMRSNMVSLFAIDGKLYGFARYTLEQDGENYVELYQLNAEGRYSSSDASTRILYTTQQVEAEAGRDPALYTAQQGDNTIEIYYDNELIQTCALTE